MGNSSYLLHILVLGLGTTVHIPYLGTSIIYIIYKTVDAEEKDRGHFSSSSVLLLETSITQQIPVMEHSRQKEIGVFPPYIKEIVFKKPIQSCLQHLSLLDAVNIFVWNFLFLLFSFLFVFVFNCHIVVGVVI